MLGKDQNQTEWPKLLQFSYMVFTMNKFCSIFSIDIILFNLTFEVWLFPFSHEEKNQIFE